VDRPCGGIIQLEVGMKPVRQISMLLAVCVAGSVQAAMPDFQVDPAQGSRLLLWVSSERGRAEAEITAAQQLVQRGVTVWSLDIPGAYFLPQLPSSMDKAPAADMADWLAAAFDSGKQVTVYAVGRAAVPVLRATARLEAGQRSRMCVLLMYPNLYESAEALADAGYLDTGRLDGLTIRLIQPRRSAATPWLPAQVAHLSQLGARVSPLILENLREGFWTRETPTVFEIEQAQKLDGLILQELESCQ
jgi:hypothetical protein